MSRVKFTVRVTPRAGVDSIDGVTEAGELRVKVRAAPADGAATSATLRTIAKAAGVAPSRVMLEHGAGSRVKRVSIEGVSEATVAALWRGLQTTTD